MNPSSHLEIQYGIQYGGRKIEKSSDFDKNLFLRISRVVDYESTFRFPKMKIADLMWRNKNWKNIQFWSNLVYGGLWCPLLRIRRIIFEIQDGESSTADKNRKITQFQCKLVSLVLTICWLLKNKIKLEIKQTKQMETKPPRPRSWRLRTFRRLGRSTPDTSPCIQWGWISLQELLPPFALTSLNSLLFSLLLSGAQRPASLSSAPWHSWVESVMNVD